jgi:nucleoside-diphosphate-sugar epimerase
MAGEGYLKAIKEYYPEFRFTSIRYYHVFGPRQDSRDGVGGVVPIFIRRALVGQEPLIVNGDGKQLRHFTYVKDVVNFNFKCESLYDGQCVSFAENGSTTVERLAKLIKRYTNSSSHIRYVPAKKGEIRHFKITENKFNKKGDYVGRFIKNLKRTIKHYAV